MTHKIVATAEQIKLFKQGSKLLDKKDFPGAIKKLKASLKPVEFKEALLNLGNAYRLSDRDLLAYEAYEQAQDQSVPFANGVFLNHNYPLASNNMGLLCYTHQQDAQALKWYEDCLHWEPLHYDAIWNYSICMLRQFSAGLEVREGDMWKLWDYRFKRGTKVDNLLPRWKLGEKVGILVVLAEQGQGDKIMMGRYFKELEKYCDELVLQVPTSLECLWPQYKCVQDISPYIGSVGVPVMQLPELFGVGVAEYIPSNVGSGIGVCWQGNKEHLNDRNRSCGAEWFEKLDEEFISLVPGETGKNIIAADCTSWQKTIETINKLDLVITVDTAVAHLSLAMGRETWVLQPRKETDWRWGKPGHTSVWYPKAKLFWGDKWSDCFEEVKQCLKEQNAHSK